MAGLGWGKKDDSTKEELAAWKQNAKDQMNGGKKNDKGKRDSDDNPPRHARKSGWSW